MYSLSARRVTVRRNSVRDGKGGPERTTTNVGNMTLTITGHTIAVALLWIAGLAFAVIDVLYVPDWAALSTAFLIGAATLTVRRCVDKYAADWTRAYEVGRDEGKVRRVR